MPKTFYQYHWRVTKYNPEHRDIQGRYLRDQWTFFAQVDTVVDGALLTLDEYMRWEDAYVLAARAFVSDSGLSGLRVVDLQWTSQKATSGEPSDIALSSADIRTGAFLTGSALEGAIRLNLREIISCKLEEPGQIHVAFGWDYYMYIGTQSPSLAAVQTASDCGLFVEAFESPYV